jgi:hypothetical protein
MDLNFIIRASIARQLQTARIRQSETAPWNHARRTRHQFPKLRIATLHTQGVSDALSCGRPLAESSSELGDAEG